MPTLGQVLSQRDPRDPPASYYAATVAAVSTRGATVNLDVGGASVYATALNALPAVGARVLILIVPSGTPYILGVIL